MAAKRITYGDITQLFEAEGFEQVVVPGSHVVFEHPASRASLILRLHKPNKIAAPRHVAMTRWTLVDFGIMSEADFDRWLANPKHFQAA